MRFVPATHGCGPRVCNPHPLHCVRHAPCTPQPAAPDAVTGSRPFQAQRICWSVHSCCCPRCINVLAARQLRSPRGPCCNWQCVTAAVKQCVSKARAKAYCDSERAGDWGSAILLSNPEANSASRPLRPPARSAAGCPKQAASVAVRIQWQGAAALRCAHWGTKSGRLGTQTGQCPASLGGPQTPRRPRIAALETGRRQIARVAAGNALAPRCMKGVPRTADLNAAGP